MPKKQNGPDYFIGGGELAHRGLVPGENATLSIIVENLAVSRIVGGALLDSSVRSVVYKMVHTRHIVIIRNVKWSHAC